MEGYEMVVIVALLGAFMFNHDRTETTVDIQPVTSSPGDQPVTDRVTPVSSNGFDIGAGCSMGCNTEVSTWFQLRRVIYRLPFKYVHLLAYVSILEDLYEKSLDCSYVIRNKALRDFVDTARSREKCTNALAMLHHLCMELGVTTDECTSAFSYVRNLNTQKYIMQADNSPSCKHVAHDVVLYQKPYDFANFSETVKLIGSERTFGDLSNLVVSCAHHKIPHLVEYWHCFMSDEPNCEAEYRHVCMRWGKKTFEQCEMHYWSVIDPDLLVGVTTAPEPSQSVVTPHQKEDYTVTTTPKTVAEFVTHKPVPLVGSMEVDMTTFDAFQNDFTEHSEIDVTTEVVQSTTEELTTTTEITTTTPVTTTFGYQTISVDPWWRYDWDKVVNFDFSDRLRVLRQRYPFFYGGQNPDVSIHRGWEILYGHIKFSVWARCRTMFKLSTASLPELLTEFKHPPFYVLSRCDFFSNNFKSVLLSELEEILRYEKQMV